MSEPTRDIVEGEVLGEQALLTLEELCRQCAIPSQQVVELVEEGVVRVDVSHHPWRFDRYALRRVHIALRLQRDLEINLAGIAVVLDLLEEVEALRRRLGSAST